MPLALATRWRNGGIGSVVRTSGGRSASATSPWSSSAPGGGTSPSSASSRRAKQLRSSRRRGLGQWRSGFARSWTHTEAGSDGHARRSCRSSRTRSARVAHGGRRSCSPPSRSSSSPTATMPRSIEYSPVCGNERTPSACGTSCPIAASPCTSSRSWRSASSSVRVTFSLGWRREGGRFRGSGSPSGCRRARALVLAAEGDVSAALAALEPLDVDAGLEAAVRSRPGAPHSRASAAAGEAEARCRRHASRGARDLRAPRGARLGGAGAR